VVAKVLRDDAMRALAGEHAGYGFERNCGYGTPEHRLALAQLGPCRVHRLSYAGVRP
jgi:ribonuclease HII